MPELVGWTVDALTTDLIGTANISYSTYDLLSGIDLSSVSLQYGFDSNGVGQTLTSRPMVGTARFRTRPWIGYGQLGNEISSIPHAAGNGCR